MDARAAVGRRDVAGLGGVNVVDHLLVQPSKRYRAGDGASASCGEIGAVRVAAAGPPRVQVAVTRGVDAPAAARVDVPEAGAADHELVVHHRVHVVPVHGTEGGLGAHAASHGAEVRRAGEVLMHPGDHAGYPPRQVRHPGRRSGRAREPAPAREAGLPAHHHHLRVRGALDLAGQVLHVAGAAEAGVQQHGLAAALPGGEGEMPAHAVHHEGHRLFGRAALHQRPAAVAPVRRHLALPPVRASLPATVGHPIVAVRIRRRPRDVESRRRVLRVGYRADLQGVGKPADPVGVGRCLAGAGQRRQDGGGESEATQSTCVRHPSLLRKKIRLPRAMQYGRCRRGRVDLAPDHA